MHYSFYSNMYHRLECQKPVFRDISSVPHPWRIFNKTVGKLLRFLYSYALFISSLYTSGRPRVTAQNLHNIKFPLLGYTLRFLSLESSDFKRYIISSDIFLNVSFIYSVSVNINLSHCRSYYIYVPEELNFEFMKSFTSESDIYKRRALFRICQRTCLYLLRIDLDFQS